MVEEGLIKAARDLRPKLTERALLAERDRRLPQETIDDLHESGLLRGVRPRRVGGYGISCEAQIEIAAELAKGCGSTAWVFTLLGGVSAFPSVLIGEEGQAEVYEVAGDRTLVCGVITPGGTATPCEGGYVVSGEWGFASGCLHADVMAATVMVLDADGQPTEPATAFFPLSEASIKDTWHVAGMRGTGSNTVIAKDVFVPAQRLGLMSTRFATEQELRPEAEPIERWPLAPFLSLGLIGPSLGAAEAVLELVSGGVHKRGVTYFDFERQADSAVVLERIGEASMRIESAWLHVRRAARELDELTKVEVLDFKTRARIRADAAIAGIDMRSAVDALVSVAGASGFAEANPIQRHWRDLNAGSRHAFSNTNAVLEMYGRAFCGVEPNITSWI
ncbi:acyl-CoA dehydrogenase family protein [Nocardia sp. R6R-6]|uniref:acyl-CoA dehydrogenase family protein n=1 Tax=Nocardia sp. R6R-6 TaxID=3459303 RepID=UPI00403E2897